jgi:tetratricopeptide (TPR) repeat protein
MIGPFYGTLADAPASRSMQSKRSMLRALGLASLLSIGLPGCGDSEPTAGDDAPRNAAPAIDAADRDASLEAIDRWLQAGRPDNAESIARTLVDRLPSDRHAHAALGRVLLARSGELRELAGPRAGAAIAAEAAGSLQTALDLAPTNDAPAIEARRSLGLALESADRDADAIAVYRGDLDDPVCRLYLGLALLRTQALDEATEVLGELADDRPDDPLVRAAMAESLLQQGRGDAAVEAAAEAVRLDPESWPIRVRRASILRRTGDPRAAIESLIALDAESRENRAVIEEIAAGWAALDRPERVAEIWAERARTSEDDLDAALAAAVAYQTAGRGGEAETWIEIASLAAPDDPRIAEARRRIAALRAATTEPTD